MINIPLVILPDPDDPECGEILVEASIAGQHYWLRLDTGSARTELVADEFLAMLAPAGQPPEAHQGVFGQPPGADVVAVDALSIGELRLAALDTIRVPAGAGRQHLLGMDVLAGHCCEFRFGTGELVLTPSGAPAAVLPLVTDDSGRPRTELHWPGGVQATASWDSGAGLSVVDAAFAGANPGLFVPDGVTAGTDSTGTQLSAPLYRMAGPAIGGTQLLPSKVAIVDLTPLNTALAAPVDLILGYPLLSQADWFFDFPASRWAPPQLH